MPADPDGHMKTSVKVDLKRRPALLRGGDDSGSSFAKSLMRVMDEGEDASVLLADIKDTVKTHFPGALASSECLAKVKKVLESRGHTAENTLFCQSVCPDEINHEPGDITTLFQEYLGGTAFHLGGLGGIPFTGKTGFTAYSHHAAEDGHLFILMAPHIGLDSELSLGKYDREGQTSSGAACGAAIGALSACMSNKKLLNMDEFEEDYQMLFIKHKISRVKHDILGDQKDPNAVQSRLAKKMHEIATEMLNSIVSVDFGGDHSTLTILTGIQINMPDPMEDYFQPIEFYVKDKTTTGGKDLFRQAFGYGNRQSLLSKINSGEDTAEMLATIKKKVDTYFPGAIPSAKVLAKVKPVIEKRGLTPKNTLFAQSLCPDEINHEPGDIPSIFSKYLGECAFHLGGLGGIPFTGKTGFAAYSHHVPNDGHCLILMAPHVGLDSGFNFGKYDRPGQACSGAACGAAIGALNTCKEGKPLMSLARVEDDYQMMYITHQVEQDKERILGSGRDPNMVQARLAAKMHEIATKMLKKTVSTDFGGPNSTLTILTGIQINMPDPMEDYFQPLAFYTMDKTKQGGENLFKEAFGYSISLKF